MKKYSLVFCLILFIGLLPISNVYGGGYLLLTGGGGGEANAGSIGGEGGWIGQNFLLGIGLSVTFTGGDWEMKYSSSGWMELPPAAYYEKHDDEYEGYGVVGIKILQDLFLIGTAGYSQETVTGKTCVGGTCVEWDPEVEEDHFTYSGQLQYVYKRLIIRGGYHNRRGIIGGIGLRF